jgi:hypothetical protein
MFRPNELHKLHLPIFISPFDLSQFTWLHIRGVVGLRHNVIEKLRHEIIEYRAVISQRAPLYLVVLMVLRQELSLEKSALLDEIIVGRLTGDWLRRAEPNP